MNATPDSEPPKFEPKNKGFFFEDVYFPWESDEHRELRKEWLEAIFEIKKP